MSTDAKKSEIKKEVSDLALSIKKGVSIDKKTAKITVDENLYTSLLPADGATVDQIKALQKHNANFVAAAHLVVAEIATPVMKAAKVSETTANFPWVGKDNLDINYRDQKEVTIPGAPEGQNKKMVYGVLSAKLETHGVHVAKGNLKAVKEHAAALGTAAFAKA